MFEEIKEKLLNYCDYPKEKLTEDTDIVKDLQVDSLNIMIIIGDLEDQYNVSIDVDDIKDVATVGDLVKLLESKTNN